MTKVRTVIDGIDTPSNHGPATILAALGVPALTDEDRRDFAARVLFRPSFQPDVCITVQGVGHDATVSLVTLQTNLWYWRCYEMQVASGKRSPDDRRPREPERWEESQPVPVDRFTVFAEEITALRPHQRLGPQGTGLDGMTVFGQYGDASGRIHDFQFWFHDPEHPRSLFVQRVYQLASDLLHDDRSQRALEKLHGYLDLGLPVKHILGRPYALRIFGRLSSGHELSLLASMAQVPGDVPLLLDLSNFDGMGTLLYPAFQEFLQRAGTTVCWATGEEARMQFQAIGVPATAIFATREEALVALELASGVSKER